ncbi:MAG: exonuclease, partial [Mesorhizobium sp.]
YGVDHAPLRAHDALDDALSLTYTLQHLLKSEKLQADVFECL